jgi:hypothetical protein
VLALGSFEERHNRHNAGRTYKGALKWFTVWIMKLLRNKRPDTPTMKLRKQAGLKCAHAVSERAS